MLMFEGKKRIVDIEYQTNELIPELPILKNSIVIMCIKCQRCFHSFGNCLFLTLILTGQWHSPY
jgi:hypothetical protein